MSAKKKTLDRGDKVIAFIERYCRAPEGMLMGQPIRLEPFQKKFIKDVYTNPHGTHTGILSIGRKNGKTALIAGIALAHIAGPEAVRNSQIVSGAMSKEQAAILFKLMVKMINLEPMLAERIKVFPSGKKLLGLAFNVEYAALAAEGKTTHGLSPILAIMDELGQVKGPTDPFVEAVETAQGAYENPLYLVISTQAPTANDMLSRKIDAQLADPNPRVVCHVYAAPDECDLDDESAWRAANPALGKFRSLTDLRNQIDKAKSQPSQENMVRNLILNQRVDMVAPFVSRSIWELNGAEPLRQPKMKVYGGLDLSEVNDLTALVLESEEDGSVFPTFWLPEHDLKGRSQRDKVPYDVWAEQGFIETTPGKTIQYRFVAQRLRLVFDEFDVQLVGFDRYHMRHLKEWLERPDPKTGKPLFSQQEIDKFVDFGQGTASMTPALRGLEEKLLEGQLRHGNHPVLSMCARNARVKGDNSARAFDKRTARGRIDGMVALAMADGVMPQKVAEETKRNWGDYIADMASA
jgi:phage terminase large subunit-like protein